MNGERRYRAPGRVNLIGEHTDYNDGFVLPAAIAYDVSVTLRPRDGRTITVTSDGFDGSRRFDLDAVERGVGHDWSDHVRGVIVELLDAGIPLGGADLHVSTTLPVGAGLSSSAAVAVATGYALLETAGREVDRVELAKIAQRAENGYAGTKSGIMDQFISANAQGGHALLLDTRSLAFEQLPLPNGAEFVICNTMVKHAHATGGYNDRRHECDAGVAALAARDTSVRALRDVTLDALEAARASMTDVVYRRCRHVITENARTRAAATALARGELRVFGELMNASNASMRDDFGLSVEEVDTMIALSHDFGDAVLGARLTGGGFGGSTVALVENAQADAFAAYIVERYAAATGLTPAIYRGVGAAGAGPEPIA